MNHREARAVAQEVMDIQMGSAEDAKYLLDDHFSSAERTMIEREIDSIARTHSEDVDIVTCSGCGAYAGASQMNKEHIRSGEPCGIYG